MHQQQKWNFVNELINERKVCMILVSLFVFSIIYFFLVDILHL